MQAVTLTELIAARIAAKRAEDAAVAERRKLDADIAALMKDANKPEGSISEKAGDWKVTVTYKLSRKVDTAKLQDDWAKLPIDVQAAFKWAADVSVTELRKLEDRSTLIASKYFETKEASPSIEIKAI